MSRTTLQHQTCPKLLPHSSYSGRYTWRHDKILHLLYQFVKDSYPDATIYCDLEGLRATDNPPSTILPSLLSATARPDLTLFYEDKVHIVELTVPWNSTENLAGARHHKETKENYQTMMTDLLGTGLLPCLTTIEIGSLGHHNPDTKEIHSQLHHKRQEEYIAEICQISNPELQNYIHGPCSTNLVSKPNMIICTYLLFSHIFYYILLYLVCTY